MAKELLINLSHSGDYEDFEVGVKDADSFELIVPTTNDAMWVEGVESLLIGTAGDEWRVFTNKLDNALTPTNFTIKQQSAYGSSPLHPVKVGEIVLFVDFVGRKFRELVFDDNKQKYVAPDLTALSENVTLGGIVDIAVQKNPDPIIWCVLSTGGLIGMVYEREQNVVAWFECPIDGLVQSVCVTPGDDEDVVTIAVKRTIDDSDVIYLEQFAPRNFGTDIEDCYFVDCGITFTSASPTTTVTGLGHLVGETIVCLADGVVVVDKVVDVSGGITLATAASKVQAGLSYTSTLEPLRPYAIGPTGPTQGSITKIPEMGISVVDTMNLKYGVAIDKLYDIDWTNSKWKNESEITGLFTGNVIKSVSGGFSLEANIILSTDSPLPAIVRALLPRVEVAGR